MFVEKRENKILIDAVIFFLCISLLILIRLTVLNKIRKEKLKFMGTWIVQDQSLIFSR